MEDTSKHSDEDMSIHSDEDILIHSDYEKRMIEAFVNKSEKTQWYMDAFDKYSRYGRDRMVWHWSWWAFFGSIFFLFYRKAYLAGLALFVVFATVSMIPLAGLVAWVLSGGYLTYVMYKVYKNRKFDIEMRLDNEERRIAEMRKLSGPNTWVIWVGVTTVGIWAVSMAILGFAVVEVGLKSLE